MITLVAAMSRGRVIGLNGGLPWHRTMKTDQHRYKAMTRGKVVVIGSSTFDPEDEYLKHTSHIYLFTNKAMEPTQHVTPTTSVKPVLEASSSGDVLVLGGASIFEQFLSFADKLELTYIDADYEGDRFFPEFDEREWSIISDEAHEADENNKHNYRFVTLRRKN